MLTQYLFQKGEIWWHFVTQVRAFLQQLNLVAFAGIIQVLWLESSPSRLSKFSAIHFNCFTPARCKVPLFYVVLQVLCQLRSLRGGMPGGRKLWVSFLWFSIFISMKFMYRLSLGWYGWFGLRHHKVVNAFIPGTVLFFVLFYVCLDENGTISSTDPREIRHRRPFSHIKER